MQAAAQGTSFLCLTKGFFNFPAVAGVLCGFLWRVCAPCSMHRGNQCVATSLNWKKTKRFMGYLFFYLFGVTNSEVLGCKVFSNSQKLNFVDPLKHWWLLKKTIGYKNVSENSGFSPQIIH